MSLALLTLLLIVWTAFCFGVFFYFLWPWLIQRERQIDGKIMIAKGMSSFWLVWPGFFGAIIAISSFVQSISLLAILLLTACMGMGMRETQRILKASGVDWSPFSMKTVDGKDILGS